MNKTTKFSLLHTQKVYNIYSLKQFSSALNILYSCYILRESFWLSYNFYQICIIQIVIVSCQTFGYEYWGLMNQCQRSIFRVVQLRGQVYKQVCSTSHLSTTVTKGNILLYFVVTDLTINILSYQNTVMFRFDPLKCIYKFYQWILLWLE